MCSMGFPPWVNIYNKTLYWKSKKTGNVYLLAYVSRVWESFWKHCAILTTIESSRVTRDVLKAHTAITVTFPAKCRLRVTFYTVIWISSSDVWSLIHYHFITDTTDKSGVRGIQRVIWFDRRTGPLAQSTGSRRSVIRQ